MSTNNECLFIEMKPNKWFYVLENYNAPKNSWDWMEYARAFGPFTTEEQAETHLSKYHANPGGWSSQAYVKDRKISKTLAELISKATR
jgi:hypothetical protein